MSCTLERRKLVLMLMNSFGAVSGSIIGLTSLWPDWTYRNVVRPLLFTLDAETAHRAAVIAAKYGLHPRQLTATPAVLKFTLT